MVETAGCVLRNYEPVRIPALVSGGVSQPGRIQELNRAVSEQNIAAGLVDGPGPS